MSPRLHHPPLHLLLITTLLTLCPSLLITHTQLSYRLGTNYAGQLTDPSLNKNCQQPQPIFNPVAEDKITIVCTLPRVYNPSTQACECLAETVYNPTTNECLCPPGKPLWNGRRCVRCPNQTFFDYEEKQCYQCPQGFIHVVGAGKSRCQPGY